MSKFLAVRSLSKRPGFTLIAVLTLALGIGATGAIFSVVYSALLRPFPFPDADRLVLLWERNAKMGGEPLPAAPANFSDWREQSRTLRYVAAMDNGTMGFAGRGDPERVEVAFVSADLLPALGVAPVAGRVFTEQDDQPHAAPVALLGQALWRSRFGADVSAVGQNLNLDGRAYQIVGVMPAGLQFLDRTDVWLPLKLGGEMAASRDAHYLRVLGRLAPGATLPRVRAELASIAGRLARQFPATNGGWSVEVVRLREQIVGKLRPALAVLFGAVAVVLLLGCVNVALLVVARTLRRQHEIAVRLAIGASPGRLLRQFLAEGMVLAGLGGAAALVLTAWVIPVLVRLGPANVPRFDDVGLNGWVVAFVVAVSLLVGVLLGLIPMLLLGGSRWQVGLKAARESSGRRSSWGRMAIVVFEMMLALVLLIAASLLARSFERLQRVDPGFDPAGVSTMDVALSGAKYAMPQSQLLFYRQVLDQLAPGRQVAAAAVATSVPLAAEQMKMRFAIVGQALPASGEKPAAGFDAVSPGYFRAMGIRLLRGRDITSADRSDAPGVVIVNAAAVRQFWGGRDPLGQRLSMRGGSGEAEQRTVIGVVGDLRQEALDAATAPHLYVPFQQRPFPFLTVIARLQPDAHDPVSVLRSAVWTIDKDQAVSTPKSMAATLAEQVARPRFSMFLMGLFAVLSLALATVGVYGLTSYVVASRSNEIGVRMALGATSRDLLTLVMRQGMAPVGAGLLIGLATAAAAGRLLASLLFETSATDPSTFAGSTGLLLLMAAIAVYIPAQRASRVEPRASLGSE